MKNCCTADFETLACDNIDKTYVWAWGIATIEKNPKFICGNTIKQFLRIIFEKFNKHYIYFHNLKFDGNFILCEILKNFKYVKKYEKGQRNVFTSIITEQLKWYQLKIYLDENNYVIIQDSLKILNYSVADIAKSFNLPDKKGEIDYKKFREEIYEMTDEEKEYLRKDVVIMANALYALFVEGFTKMTDASEALKQYKDMLGGDKNFRQTFPLLEADVDSYCRKSYKGAFVLAEKNYRGKTVGRGAVIDNNSLYPYCYGGGDFLLPYGEPIYYKGKYKTNPLYPLYICKIQCMFKIKKGYLPIIQLKHVLSFSETEYLESSGGEEIELTLTSVELELFLKHYDTFGTLEYIDGYMFKGSKNLFTKYVQKYTKQKIEAKKEGNLVKYLLAKLMLNSLYGKFGMAIVAGLREPYLENGVLKFAPPEMSYKEPIYVPLASFVTAYGRFVTITNAQKLHTEKRFLYSDTDSLHFLLFKGEDVYEVLERLGIEIDKYELGKWDIEIMFTKAKYLRSKCYIEKAYLPDKKGKLFDKITVAGLPHVLHKYVNFENFDYGLNIENFDIKDGKTKLRFKNVQGGCLLIPAAWEIKR